MVSHWVVWTQSSREFCPPLLLSLSSLASNSTALSCKRDLQRLSSCHFSFRTWQHPALPRCKCVNDADSPEPAQQKVLHWHRLPGNVCTPWWLIRCCPPTGGMDLSAEGFLLSRLLSCHSFPNTEPFSITQHKQSEMCNHEPVWSEECACVL